MRARRDRDGKASSGTTIFESYGLRAFDADGTLTIADLPVESTGPNQPVLYVSPGLGVWTASPWAFLAFAAYVAVWLSFDPHALDWHGIATLATWLMTLCIQRAEHRDTQALQAKIDALIRALPEAENALTRIDEKEPEAIERERAQAQRQ